MLFRYQPFTAPLPVVSLGGRPDRPRPVVFLSVIGPAGTHGDEGHIDTGADDTVFEERVASLIGIDLTNAPVRTASGVGLVPSTVRYAQVTLRLTDGTEFREWPAWVGFTSARLKQPLLGYAGFLRFFTATFDGERERVELAVNGLYPGA
jgi:hypothetical protein